MKIWNAFGTEHSMNLVMIGRFKEVRNAEEAKRLIDRLTEQVIDEGDAAYEMGSAQRRYSEAMRDILKEEKVYDIAPAEFDQFRYDVSVDQREEEVSVRTDEVDISAFLKVLIDKGARVEIYSGHDYPEEQEKGADQP